MATLSPTGHGGLLSGLMSIKCMFIICYGHRHQILPELNSCESFLDMLAHHHHHHHQNIKWENIFLADRYLFLQWSPETYRINDEVHRSCSGREVFSVCLYFYFHFSPFLFVCLIWQPLRSSLVCWQNVIMTCIHAATAFAVVIFTEQLTCKCLCAIVLVYSKLNVVSKSVFILGHLLFSLVSFCLCP